MSSVFWTSLGASHSCSSSASFLRLPLPNFSFVSFYPLLVCLPPPAFPGFSGFASFLWFAFLQFRLWLHFLCPLVLTFLHAMVRSAPCVLSQSSFPRAVATVACFHSSFRVFRLLQFWLSLPVSLPLFGLVCFFLLSGLLPGFSASCASGCSSLLLLHRLSVILRVLLWLYLGCPGAVYPAFLLGLFSLGFLRLLRVSSLSIGLRSLSWCLFLLVVLVVFFAPVLVHSPPVLPCSVAVAFVCLFF